MRYFLSHASDGTSYIEGIIPVLQEIEPGLSIGEDVFYSSNYRALGAAPGQNVIGSVSRAMESSDCIILLLTGDYLRKPYCLYEASLASYLHEKDGKLVVPVASSSAVYAPLKNLFPGLIYVNAGSEGAASRFFASFGLKGEPSKRADAFFARFAYEGERPSELAPLGVDRERHAAVVPYLRRSGIVRFDDGAPTSLSSLAKTLERAREIYFVSTTGASFLKTNRELFAAAVRAGASFHAVLAASGSRDLSAVAAIEGLALDEGAVEANRSRLDSEILSSLSFLREIAEEGKGDGSGGVYAYPARGLIRQTAFLVVKNDGSLEGWITLTLPPARTADGTPSIVFKGKRGEEGKKALPELVYRYASSLVELSRKKGDALDLGAAASLSGLKERESSSFDVGKARKHYEEKRALALGERSLREANVDGRYEGALIEIAAQHPLRDDGTPGEEFARRLDRGYELYFELLEKGEKAAIYVPGSRHLRPGGKGKADRCSLSSAGLAYLRKKEPRIPGSALYGEKINERYRGEDGVYNSADECYCAAQLYHDGGFKHLYSVCSSNQLLRKEFFYLEQGVMPDMVPVYSPVAFHADFVEETFASLLPTLFDDHTWLEKDSEPYFKTREARKPGFKKG